MWLYIPKTTSRCTQVAADSISDSDSRIQLLAQSFTWNESFKQPRSWLTILKRASWSLHLFGLIPEPSIADHSLTEWIGSLGDSPASRGVSQAPEQGPTTTVGSGLTSSDWFARYDHEESLWKTSQASFMEELNTFSEGWPRSGSMRNGLLYERPTLVRPIAGSESSSWPSAAASDPYTENMKSEQTKPGSMHSMTLPRATKEWQTPAAFQGKFRRQVRQTERTEELLPGQAQNWPSPVAADGAQGAIENENTKYVTLKSGRLRKISNSGESGSLGLAREVKHWLTPSANEDAAGTVDGNMQNMLSHQVQEATGVTSTNDTGRRLNPEFVTWLMGLPDSWLDMELNFSERS